MTAAANPRLSAGERAPVVLPGLFDRARLIRAARAVNAGLSTAD